MYYYNHMKIAPKGLQAARLRQRKFELLRREVTEMVSQKSRTETVHGLIGLRL